MYRYSQHKANAAREGFTPLPLDQFLRVTLWALE